MTTRSARGREGQRRGIHGRRRARSNGAGAPPVLSGSREMRGSPPSACAGSMWSMTR